MLIYLNLNLQRISSQHNITLRSKQHSCCRTKITSQPHASKAGKTMNHMLPKPKKLTS